MSEDILGILMVPALVFLVIVAPVWIVFHYRAVERRDRAAKAAPISAEDQEMTTRMAGLLEKMEARIATLEKILDVEDPKWREKQRFSERS